MQRTSQNWSFLGLRIDARVVAATNQDVEGLLASGRFRRDLFFRVAVLRVTLPPLREHREDIPALVHHILKTAARDTGLAGAKRIGINPGALKELTAHDWPGNVRELRNLVHRAVLEAADGVITRELVRSLLQASPASPPGQPGRTLEEIEREAIVNCLRDCDYSRKAAARRLGIALSTLYDKIRRYGLETPRASGS